MWPVPSSEPIRPLGASDKNNKPTGGAAVRQCGGAAVRRYYRCAGLSAPKYGQLIARVRPGQAMKVGRMLTTGLGQSQAQ